MKSIYLIWIRLPCLTLVNVGKLNDVVRVRLLKTRSCGQVIWQTLQTVEPPWWSLTCWGRDKNSLLKINGIILNALLLGHRHVAVWRGKEYKCFKTKTSKLYVLSDLEMIIKNSSTLSKLRMSMLKISTFLSEKINWQKWVKRFVNFLRSRLSYNFTIICKMTVWSRRNFFVKELFQFID